jgi:hypothetical protein
VLTKGEDQVSEKAVQDVISNINSPIEVAALIKKLGVPFSKRYLSSTEYVSDYSTGFQQAFALGVFGADMGYLNMYQKTSAMLDYLSAIKTTSEAINVGQFFDFSTLKRLATNNTNLDSLKYISVHNFNQMDKYLRDNNRGSLSSLMITGAWIEGLYLLTQIQRDFPSKQISDRIAEQQVFIPSILMILKSYSKDPDFKALYDDFMKIKEIYSEVKIEVVQGEPEMVEQDGMMVSVQKDVTTITMSDGTLNQLTDNIASMREKMLKVR